MNGPNINAPMDTAVYAKAYELVQKAKSKLKYASDKEAMLINALSVRYPSPKPVSDRSAIDSAYAEAMKLAMKQFPDDDDIATMTAEALMDKHPWNFWLRNGSPKPWTAEIISILETVLKRSPNHPGANHYYIHTLEASKHAELAIPSAERLDTMIPGAGHLVHMPAHIYLRVGRYHDASLANERAIKVDSTYLAENHVHGMYPAMYVNHNYHFLFVAAAFEGRSAESIWAAEHIASHLDPSMMKDPAMSGSMQQYLNVDLVAYVRFGKWDKILSLPKPDTSLKFSAGIWHFARGYAFLAENKMKEAEAEEQQLIKIAADTSMQGVVVFGINNTYLLLNIASNTLKGEIEAKKKNTEAAKKYFTAAIAIEDSTSYDEPPDWFFPVRNAYGAVLFDAGDYKTAEQVYRED